MDCTALIEQTDKLKAKASQSTCSELLQQVFSLEDRLLTWYARIQNRAGQPMPYDGEEGYLTPFSCVSSSSAIADNLPAQAGEPLRFNSLSAAQAHVMYWATMLLLYQVMEDLQELMNQDLRQSQSSPSAGSTENDFLLASPQSSNSMMQCLALKQELDLDFADWGDLSLDPEAIQMPSPLLAPTATSPSTSYSCNTSQQQQHQQQQQQQQILSPPLSSTATVPSLITTPDLSYSYACLLCRSARYCMDPSMKALGPQILLFPLWLAKEFFLRSGRLEMHEWCCDMLRVMGDLGICCAPAMGMGDEDLADNKADNNGQIGYSVPVY